MKILMLGWEFPPLHAGGVGIVCYELSKALCELGEDIEITYIMPFGPRNTRNIKEAQHLNLLIANNEISNKDISISITVIPVMFHAYMTPDEYKEEYDKMLLEESDIDENNFAGKKLYGKDVYLEVERFAQKVKEIAKRGNFDIIHANDWMTIPAGILAKEVSGKPLVLHVHNTVYDRYLGMGGEHEKEIEYKGYEAADIIISISNYPVSDHLINKYKINPSKIKVIHNGAGLFIEKLVNLYPYDIGNKPQKLVYYGGRVVLQKGPEYFVEAAIKALKYEPSAHFLIAGEGHMVPHLKYMVEQAGVQSHFTITGKHYTKEEGNKYFQMADVFVMPSVSEPFGIVPIEAIAKGTPVIITYQSGISEVLEHCFKVDYWNTDEMAHQIISLLRYNPLHAHMRESSFNEFHKFDWAPKARELYNIYKGLISRQF